MENTAAGNRASVISLEFSATSGHRTVIVTGPAGPGRRGAETDRA
jgi:hypothetical protein